jgi:RHS repeat-associated protein
VPPRVKIEAALYKPFSEQSEWVLPGNAAPETKGWIGERYDADAGLQYLNERYYDPELSLLRQPDWFEVTKAGVRNNRFGYSGNDPNNPADSSGNSFWTNLVNAIRDFFSPNSGVKGTAGGSGSVGGKTGQGRGGNVGASVGPGSDYLVTNINRNARIWKVQDIPSWGVGNSRCFAIHESCGIDGGSGGAGD